MHNSVFSVSSDRFKGIKHMVGNTPLLEIRFAFRGKSKVIYAKAEHMNMTGSIKDRMAFHIMQCAYRAGTLTPGMVIGEATSGNTGISFAAIGRSLGHEVVIFMPDWMSRERVDLIRSLGATIRPVSREQGGFIGSIRQAEEMAKHEQNVFLPSQFSNQANVEAHELTTGPEIWWQLQFNGLQPDAFVAGIGTGGTIMGVGQYFRRQNANVKLYPVQPAESPTLTVGHKIGHHRIQGISDEFIPAIVKLNHLDTVVDAHDGDAILMAQKLAAQLGIAVGISSGANFIGALKVLDEHTDDAVVVTVFPDDNKKYLSTDLLREEPAKPDYVTPDVEFTDYRAHKRVCHTCCDLYDCNQHIDHN